MSAPSRPTSFGVVDVEQRQRPDGSLLLQSRTPLAPYPRTLTDRLLHWAQAQPDVVFMARRDPCHPNQEWQRLTYRQALSQAASVGQALLDRKLSAERPIAIVSDNSLEHAVMALAALHVGVPFAAISPSYALLSSDFGKLRHILDMLAPGLVMVSDGAVFERALAACVRDDVEVVVCGAPLAARATTPFRELAATTATAAVDAAHQAIEPDQLAKILFTSGSTGKPKGVINTHRMLCANLRQIIQCFPCMVEERLTLVDWLPWNHTFGGNHNFGLVLDNGGTMYLDDGKPTPAGIGTTVANLREIAPTVYFNVPKGFVELLPHLEADPQLRERFFSRLQLLFYAGAGLAQPVWDALERLSVQTTGARVVITSGLGCTESGPSALFAHHANTWSGLLGTPVPGLELKLAKVGDKLEARYRGPNVTPGYFRDPEATAAAFDEAGFYRTGDAVRLVDAGDPNRGMLFDGRIAEDFKLNTGTWVSVGSLRAAVVDACAPLIADAVLTGLDRGYVGAILFPSLPACAQAAGLSESAEPKRIVDHPAVRDRVTGALAALRARATGSSNRVERAVVTHVPASVDRGEMTDKGSLNQRAVLDHRAALVEALYSEDPIDEVLIVGGRAPR